MQEIEIEVTNKEGIHSRPSNIIAELANSFPDCKITLITENGKEADAKSVVEIIVLGAMYKEKIKIIAKGKNDKEAIVKLASLFKSNFGIGDK